MTDAERWDAEFCGFFWGEGSFDLCPFRRKGQAAPSYTPRARIALSARDRGVLDECMERFGGSLYYRAATDAWCWQLTGKQRMTVLLDVLSRGVMGAIKRREVALMQEAVALIPARGVNYTTEVRERMTCIHASIKARGRAA